MPIAFFQVNLSVQPKYGGEAEFFLPEALKDLPCHFVIIKDDGEEGIVKIEQSDAILKEVGKEKSCKKLTAKQMETLRRTYPQPRLKKKYRERIPTEESNESEPIDDEFEVDNDGNRIIDTFQTVRSGFYLIDVPVSA